MLGHAIMPMGLERAGVVRDGMACLGINPTTPHGKVILHFEPIMDLLKIVGNVESGRLGSADVTDAFA